jgi:hypothetical protein
MTRMSVAEIVPVVVDHSRTATSAPDQHVGSVMHADRKSHGRNMTVCEVAIAAAADEAAACCCCYCCWFHVRCCWLVALLLLRCQRSFVNKSRSLLKERLLLLLHVAAAAA